HLFLNSSPPPPLHLTASSAAGFAGANVISAATQASSALVSASASRIVLIVLICVLAGRRAPGRSEAFIGNSRGARASPSLTLHHTGFDALLAARRARWPHEGPRIARAVVLWGAHELSEMPGPDGSRLRPGLQLWRC